MTSLAHYIYVAEGFMEDCDMLIRTLTDKYEKVDWQKFCEHWKELQFDFLFYKRLSGAELVELTEECFQCARLYMVTETDNFEEQVIGIFIAYAISIVQPFNELCSLRLTPQDVAPLKRVENIARRDNRTDVLMILGRLYVYSTHYHVSHRERAMDYVIRKYYDDTIRVPKRILRQWHGELNRNNVKSWERIGEIEKKYMESKKRFNLIAHAAYPGSKVLLDTAVPIAEEITDSLRKLIMGPKKEKEKDEVSSISDLKSKAMKNIVNPMRHLTSIDERKSAASPQANSPAKTQPKTVTKSVRSKIKENSQNVIVGKGLKQYTRPVNEPESKVETPTMKPLPSLEKEITLPNCTDILEDTPEHLFRGFTAEEIEKTNAELNSDKNTNKKTKKRRQNDKKTLKSAAKTSSANIDNADLEDSNNIQKRKINGKKVSVKRKAISPKKTVKKKKNRKSKLLSDSDSNSNNSSIDLRTIDNILPDHESELKTKDNKESSETIEKILPQESNADKSLVQYKINDIVIHADKGLPDLEIEWIDQYTGPLDNDTKQIPETTEHKDISKPVVPEDTNDKPIETVDEEETVEVVRILTESEAAIIETKESLVVPRRKRKRPSLQSKLRRMGILPVANFYNDEVNGS